MRLNSRRAGPVLLLAVAGMLLVFSACELLFGIDDTAPTCTMLSPLDSAVVSGVELVRASASDTNGITRVEFYVDGALVGSDTTGAHALSWDTRGLADESWHKVSCSAYDPDGNRGTSDTSTVQVVHGRQRDVIHAEISDLRSNFYAFAGFAAEKGETLDGEFFVLGGAALSRFAWLDGENYHLFATGGSYTPVLQEVDKGSFSLRQSVPATDSFYLVFLNTSASSVALWARFTLE